MSEHLPECEDIDDECIPFCICDRLRACEARMRSEMYTMNEMDERCVQAADEAVADALDRVELLNKERGYGMSSEFYEMTGDSYAEGWTDLLSLIRLTIAPLSCAVCGEPITDWGHGDWHHVPPRTAAYFWGHDHAAVPLAETLKGDADE